MCFSIEADLIVGTAVTAVGVHAIRAATSRPNKILATVPILLGAHLLVEAVVWWAVDGSGPDWAGDIATWLYLAIALTIVPIAVPVAVLAAEASPQRRGVIGVFVGLGTFAAGALFNALLTGPVSAQVDGHHIAYSTGVSNGGLLVAIYVIGTCGAALASSSKDLAAFGAINLAVVLVLILVQETALISLWCAWAAITSILITYRIHMEPAPQPPQPQPRGRRHLQSAARVRRLH
jgi:hypothetical protein